MASLPRPAMRLFRALPNSLQQRAVRAITPSYTLGAQARIERADGRILLVKAAYRWRWGLPGGLMNAHESPADAVLRETREEVGLAIELHGEPVVIVETDLQRVNFIYHASPFGDVDLDALTPQASEILELGWFDPSDLPETIPDATSKVFLSRSDLDHAQVVVTSDVPESLRPITDSFR